MFLPQLLPSLFKKKPRLGEAAKYVRPGGSSGQLPRRDGDRRYASAGEWVTCENGHRICQMSCDVDWGGLQMPDSQFTNWQQSRPRVGQLPLPRCELCNALFTDGARYHFSGWR